MLRFGSIYEMEEKEEAKEEESDEDNDVKDDKAPTSDILVTCYVEEELTSAHSMYNLMTPPAAAQLTRQLKKN